MANIETVSSATAINAVVDNNTLNPASTHKNAIVHITLKFRDVTFTPDDLYDALDAQWPVVASSKTSLSHNHFDFTITA